jgi:hypothetical protein
VQMGCCRPERGGSAPWSEALHPAAENSQTRNRTPLCLTEPHRTVIPLDSETLSVAPRFFRVPQNRHPTTNAALPALAARSRERTSSPPSQYKSISSANFGTLPALAPAMHFAWACVVRDARDAKPERTSRFSIAALVFANHSPFVKGWRLKLSGQTGRWTKDARLWAKKTRHANAANHDRRDGHRTKVDPRRSFGPTVGRRAEDMLEKKAPCTERARMHR